MSPFRFHPPHGSRIPILLSVPHCGTSFPPDLVDAYKPELILAPDDTDWFVDQLYDFAPAIGITMITAEYSRWVIDLNRDPNDKPLYTDGRIITGLCPATNFLGERLYKDERERVADDDVDIRRKRYYEPYHQKISETLKDLKAEFGKVLLWDCHSIRQYVKTIYNDKFPDLILGDADGAAASPQLIDIAFNALKSSDYSVSHNFPFKGGYITRHYGKPLENQQALQLEMCKLRYMDDAELGYDLSRAGKMRELLERTLLQLADSLSGKSQHT